MRVGHTRYKKKGGSSVNMKHEGTRKAYFEPQADVVLMLQNDIVTLSSGEDHGGNIPTKPDEDWDLGEYVITR